MSEDYDDEVLLCAENITTFTNVSADPWQYISCFRGPQTQDINFVVTITFINAVIFITGIVGNILVVFVIVKHVSLHTPTNYYLLNLAVSDLTLLLFGLPYDVSLYWHQYPWILGVHFCKARALISEGASYVSVLTVVAFSMERYLAICHPLYTLAITNLQRSLLVIILLWFISIISAIPFSIYSEVHYITYPLNSSRIIPESAFCAMINQPENIPLTEISSAIFFIMPLIVIIILYIKMGLVIRSNASDGGLGRIDGSVHRRNRRSQAHSKNIIKMLALVVFGFFACWFPFHAQRLASIYLRSYDFYDGLNYWMYIVTGMFYYLSSTLNPIVYNVMSDRMRIAFKEVLFGIKPTNRFSTSNPTTKESSHGCVSKQQSTSTNREEHSIKLVRTTSIHEVEEGMNLIRRDHIIVYSSNCKGNPIIEVCKALNGKEDLNVDETSV